MIRKQDNFSKYTQAERDELAAMERDGNETIDADLQKAYDRNSEIGKELSAVIGQDSAKKIMRLIEKWDSLWDMDGLDVAIKKGEIKFSSDANRTAVLAAQSKFYAKG